MSAELLTEGLDAIQRIEGELKTVSAALDALERAGAEPDDAGMLARCRQATTDVDDELGLIYGTLVAEQLPVLPAPLGFQPHRLGTTNRLRARQHKMGPDPPSALA